MVTWEINTARVLVMSSLADHERYKGNFPSFLELCYIAAYASCADSILSLFFIELMQISLGRLLKDLATPWSLTGAPHLLMFWDCRDVCCWLLVPGISLLTGIFLQLSRLLVNLFW